MIHIINIIFTTILVSQNAFVSCHL